MAQMDFNVWDGVSAVVAALALILSIIVFLTQRRRDRQQTNVQERLAAIEEARRGDEVQRQEEQKLAALIADVRVVEFRLERGGRAGESDRVSITIENRGPAVARELSVALWEHDDRAPSSLLGELVESREEIGGWGYYQIETDKVEALARGHTVRLPFWLRYRLLGNQKLRLAWADGRGPQVAYLVAEFIPDPAGRF